MGPGYKSPLAAMAGPRETIIYVTCIQPYGKQKGKPDYLATIDVNPESDQYCRVISRAFCTHTGDELHHFGWNTCSSCFCNPNQHRDKLICPTLNSDRVYIFDTTSQREPKLFKVIETEALHSNDVSAGHTSHCLPSGEVMISCMGDRNRRNKGSFLLLDGKTFEIKGLWNSPENVAEYGYDFWYQPRHQVMISSEWGAPRTFEKGFNLADVQNNLYGHSLNVWNWSSRKLIQTIDLGSEGIMPLEIRFLHNPSASEGYVGCALSTTVFRFYKTEDNEWEAKKVITIPSKKVENWLLGDMPGLITDILISLDDRFLYLSLWLFGEVHQYDITDTSNPKLVGKCSLGGSLYSPVKVVGQDLQTDRLIVKNKVIKGGPQMLQLSLDGRRLYVTNSLYSVWDKQFYPEMVSEGSVMLQIDVDVQRGGLSINPNFMVDFGKEKSGPVLAHEMRYPGGDPTSDIWL